MVLGSRGFIGSSLVKELRKREQAYLAISKSDIDLSEYNSTQKLIDNLQPTDFVIFTSAITPCRSINEVIQTFKMVNNLIAALKIIQPKRFVLISSDSVYGDKSGAFTEESPCNPSNYHGLAQLGRELSIKQSEIDNLAILRLCAVYGYGDTHGSYGPNRFISQILENKKVTLFGQGLNVRDHIYISDVVDLTLRVLFSEFKGTLNVASGNSYTFADVAKICLEKTNSLVGIELIGSEGPILEKLIDINSAKRQFPDYKPLDLASGISKWISGINSGNAESRGARDDL